MCARAPQHLYSAGCSTMQRGAMYDVISVGSATVDAFINTGSQLFRKSGKGCAVNVPFGSKILIEDLKFSVGGGATNTAVAFARMGLKAACISSIGKGGNSYRVMSTLKKEGVDTSFMVSKGGRTGFSIILDSTGHDRTILAFKGNNNLLAYDHIQKSRLRTKWFYLCAMLGQSFQTEKKIVAFAKKHGSKVMYNPSAYLAKKGAAYLKPILSQTDILVLNKEEAAYLVGNHAPKVTLKKLMALGPDIVVVTDGQNPAYASHENTMYSIVPPNVHVAETTGAGDAFGSGFLAAMIHDDDIEHALKIGTANACSKIQKYGAQSNLLSYNEAEKQTKKLVVKRGQL